MKFFFFQAFQQPDFCGYWFLNPDPYKVFLFEEKPGPVLDTIFQYLKE